METSMSASSVALALCLSLLSACAAPSSLPAGSLRDFTTEKGRCELNSGVWHTNLGICELL